MRQIRQYDASGERFACDEGTMTRTLTLRHDELDRAWDGYEMDHELAQDDIDHSRVIRSES